LPAFLLTLTGCAGLVSVYIEPTSEPVRAGESVNLNFTLDRAPNFGEGEIQVTVAGPQASNAKLMGKVKIHPGVRIYQVSIHVPPSAPGGTWSVDKVTLFTGAQEIPLPFKNQTFQVAANPNIVFPTSVQVTLSLSEAQLLRTEAVYLRARLQALKANIAVGSQNSTQGSVAQALRTKIDAELGFLAATEARFHALSSSEPQANGAASVFFGDLRVSYEDAKAQLKDRSTRSEWSGSFKWASLSSSQVSNQRPAYPVLAQAVFRVFEQNELAYVTVANAESLTFDLDVSTSPEGATISYRRRGDSYRQHPDQTNSVIRALPYAIWTVRLQKQGYRDEEREHDPFREPNHVINVPLTK